jgi:hypothetical protein
VIVAVASFGCMAEPTARLHLLGPDEWAFSVRQDGSFTGTPPTGCAVDMLAGEVPMTKLGAFLECFRKLFDQASKKSGEQRSAAEGKQGHQKTPAFIFAVMEDALAGREKPLSQPRGGFTDVGLHTGGIARATAWPLAAAVARFALEQLHPRSDLSGEHDFRCVLAEWELWLAEAALDPLATLELSDIARMLDSAAGRCAALADAGYNVDTFVSRTATVRAKLSQSMALMLREQAEPFVMSDDVVGVLATGDDGTRHTLPKLHLPQRHPAQREAIDIPACRSRAERNLGSLPLACVSETTSPTDVISWVGKVKGSDVCDVCVAGIEQWVFSNAVRLLDKPPSGDNAVDVSSNVVALNKLADMYRICVAKLRKATDKSAGRLRVEIDSRETLAMWAIACLADIHVRWLHPDLNSYVAPTLFGTL